MPEWEGKEVSVHAASFPEPVSGVDPELITQWDKLLELREAVLKALEDARNAKQIGQGLDAHVVLHVPQAWQELVECYRDELPQLFIVSQVSIVEDDGLAVEVRRADGEKCERCWMWSPTVGESPDVPKVCDRCAGVLRRLEEQA